MNKQELFVNVILPLPLPDFFTYRVPEILSHEIEIGKRVLVPFGRNKFYAAIIYTIHSEKPTKYQTKNIVNVLDETPIVNERQLSLWIWIADYYMCSYGEVMAIALPSAFKLASESKIGLHSEFDGDISLLSEKEIQIVSSLMNSKTLSIKQIEKICQHVYVLPLIKSLVDKGIIFFSEEVETRYKAKMETYVYLSEKYTTSEEALNQLFQELELSKQTQKQSDALLYVLSLLQRETDNLVSKNKLTALQKITDSQLTTLVKKGILKTMQLPVSRLPIFFREKAPSVIELSSYQEKAFTSIQQQFEFFNTVLLHGVTGSGKTEIYIKLIQEEIDKGKQVLYLLPEIALTTQIINRLRKYFGNKVGVYHSRFNESERVEIWQEVLSRDESSYQIIIGARSALFLPFYNLGLIIVDEEHDVSYKQFEPNPHYHARDSAMVLAQIHKAKTLLGSATPSIETYYNTVKNKFGLVTLHQRFGGLALPEIKIIDIKKEGRNEQGYSPYTKSLLHHIEKALERKEQVILFQNRRGFSVHLECKVCNFIPSCKNCDVTLTYHKTINQLRCHYCGYSENVPKACDMCKNSSMEMRGTGTEKIEEDLQIIFPSANITRLDYDSTRSKTAYQHIISNFENRKIDILVGTQMITKGLDFDNVSTVGILNADNMLFYPDFRSFERAYQLIAQVSGRAGRKNKQGIVLLQTFNPGHPIFQYVLNNDYFSLFEKTLLERKQFNYPPICRFIKITLKHKKNENLNHLAEEFAILLRKIFPNKVLGPEYPPIIKLKNMYQKDIILKIYPSKNLPLCKREIKKIISLPLFKSIQIHIDVDPY